MASSSYRYDAALLGVVLIWGINFPVIKVPLEVMPPFAANVFRFAASAVTLGVVYAARTDGPLFAPMRTHGSHIAALGLLGHAAYQICFILGVAWTTAGNAALIMAAAPLWTALASRAGGFERLPRAAWAGLLVSLAGAALVVTTGADLAGGSLAGNALMLSASALWGVYTAYNTPVVRDVSPSGFAFLSILVALPVLFALGVPHFGAVEWAQVGAVEWAALIFSGAFSTGVAYLVWAMAVKQVGASSTAAYSNLVPFVALLGGVLLLGEAVTGGQVLGGVLIIGGLVVLRRSRRAAAVEV